MNASVELPRASEPCSSEPCPIEPALTIYYDRACPLCAAEMHVLQRHAGDRLRLVDCSPTDFADADVATAGFERAALMDAMHARAADGTWFVGVPAFERAYRVAGLESVARMFGHPRLHPLWVRLYPWIARHRMLLSRLGLAGMFGRVVALMARRSGGRSARCRDGDCRATQR